MSTLKVTNISDGTDTVETGYVVNGSAKAWVNGQSDATVLDSLNISSGVDTDVGTYEYTYTSSFSSGNYSSQSEARIGSQNSYTANTQSKLVGSLTIRCYAVATDTKSDRENMATAHGDLA